jgi:hypothetical protein
MVTFEEVSLDRIRDADLSNDEILELTIFFSEAEDITPYHAHIQLLRSKYDVLPEILSFEMELFKYRSRLDARRLRNIYVALEDVGYEPMFYDLLNGYQQDPNAGVYLRLMNEAFGTEPDEDFCQDALRYIEVSGPTEVPDVDPEVCHEFLPNGTRQDCQKLAEAVEETKEPMQGPGVSAITRYLTVRISQIAPFEETPAYIREFDIDLENLPQVQLRNIDADLPPEEIAEELLNSAEGYGLVLTESANPDVDDPHAAAVEKITSDLEKLSFPQLSSYLAPFRYDPNQVVEVQRNKDLFRLYGPVNPHPNDDYSELTQTNDDGEDEPNFDKIYGGPRMFISLEYEYDQDADLPTDDWFTGYCLQCLKRIRKRHYAVRRPYIGGGWVGCYGSWMCVKTAVLTNSEVDEEDLDNKEIVALQVALCDEFEAAMNQIGIQEREGGEYEPDLLDGDLPDPSIVDRLPPPLSEQESYDIPDDLIDLMYPGADAGEDEVEVR